MITRKEYADIGKRMVDKIGTRENYYCSGECPFWENFGKYNKEDLCILFDEPIKRSCEQGDWYRCPACLTITKKYER